MPEHVLLAPWESFYVIVGSSAGALTGLMFVVIALIAEVPRVGSPRAVAAYGTPTVVHFCAALLISAILSAPWRTMGGPDWTLGALGVAGVGYVALVTRRAMRQSDYKPVLEDWIWHTVLPFISYALLVIVAFTLRQRPGGSLFAVGASALLLLFVGIHNSWDTVTFIAFRREEIAPGAGPIAPAPPADAPPASAPAGTAAGS